MHRYTSLLRFLSRKGKHRFYSALWDMSTMPRQLRYTYWASRKVQEPLLNKMDSYSIVHGWLHCLAKSDNVELNVEEHYQGYTQASIHMIWYFSAGSLSDMHYRHTSLLRFLFIPFLFSSLRYLQRLGNYDKHTESLASSKSLLNKWIQIQLFSVNYLVWLSLTTSILSVQLRD